MAKYLMVRENQWIGINGYGALFQVAYDENASGGWICREVHGEDIVADVEPDIFKCDEEEALRFCPVHSVWEYSDWQEARAASLAANETYA